MLAYSDRILLFWLTKPHPVIAQLVERETVVVLIAGISRSLVRIRFAGFLFGIIEKNTDDDFFYKC